MTPEEVFQSAITLHQSGRLDEAQDFYDQLLAQFPEHPDTLNLRGLLDIHRQRFSEALIWLDRALKASPEYGGAHANRAVALLALGRLTDALSSSERALALDPNLHGALGVQGDALSALGRAPEAMACYRRLLEVDPADLQVRRRYANVLRSVGQSDEAASVFEAGLRHNPDVELLEGEVMHLRMQACQWDGFADRVEHLLQGVAQGRRVIEPLALIGLPSNGAQQKAAAKAYALPFPASAQGPRIERRTGERLRIGYFSSDLHDHAVAHLMLGLLEAHDRTQVEIVCFAFGGDAKSGMRQRIARAVDQVFDVADMPDSDVIKLAHQLRVHIAIDLNGYTGGARLGLFAARVAPVQVNFLGFPGTLGSICHDYIIGDGVVTPRAAAAEFTECIVQMPGTYLVNSMVKLSAVTKPVSRRDLGLPEQGFIFCCFNSVTKITPDVFDIWMRLLIQADGSVVWLSEDPNSLAAASLRAEAQRRGVAPERLFFTARNPGPDYLARFRLADLFLDTFYYNAHATAADALLVGLPLVTRTGAAFAGRVGASLLTAIGLPELIASDAAAYEQLALRLAREPQALKALREKLAVNASTYPLFDIKRYARDLEAAYREMWRRAENGLAPDHIQVANLA